MPDSAQPVTGGRLVIWTITQNLIIQIVRSADCKIQELHGVYSPGHSWKALQSCTISELRINFAMECHRYFQWAALGDGAIIG